MSIPQVDGLLTDPREMGRHRASRDKTKIEMSKAQWERHLVTLSLTMSP